MPLSSGERKYSGAGSSGDGGKKVGVAVGLGFEVGSGVFVKVGSIVGEAVGEKVIEGAGEDTAVVIFRTDTSAALAQPHNSRRSPA